MSDVNKIRVIPHRGAMQIGGVCTEIATDNLRILFDFGSPLEGEGRQDILDIDGVTTGKANCDAVFITHYHGDHVGEVPNIMADIPVYMHKTAREILQAQQEHKVSVGQIVWAKGIKELSDRRNEWPMMSQRMKELYERKYSWEEMEHRLIQLYHPFHH